MLKALKQMLKMHGPAASSKREVIKTTSGTLVRKDLRPLTAVVSPSQRPCMEAAAETLWILFQKVEKSITSPRRCKTLDHASAL